MNLLIANERARSDRYRVTLDNLAHSLKTPLAAIRALLSERDKPEFEDRANEQIERMDEIVRYQLRKPAAARTEGAGLAQVAVDAELQKLVAGLAKVHHEKSPQIKLSVSGQASCAATRVISSSSPAT